ncbi:hypothetical protein LINPERHAP1_LOCUS10365, partial [Linum perenne]
MLKGGNSENASFDGKPTNTETTVEGRTNDNAAEEMETAESLPTKVEKDEDNQVQDSSPEKKQNV